MQFDEIYSSVPADQREGLRQFREENQAIVTTIGETDWTYYSLGTGNSGLLWLVGGLKRADAAYRSLPLLADQFRVIVPDYPALGTMDALAEGLAALLDREGLARVDVLAGSFGGMLAQVFVRLFPERVRKLILSTTTAPEAAQAERYSQLLVMVQAAPPDILRTQAEAQMYGVMSPPETEAEFWRAYLRELYHHRLNKQDLASTYAAIVNFMLRDFSASDLSGWDGELLILSSEDDQTFGSAQQSNLKMLYPMASHHVFTDAGHSPGSTQRAAYFAKVRSFLTS